MPADCDLFEEIGDDEILHVFEFFNVAELVNASEVCTRWANLAQTECLWKRLCKSCKQLSFKPDDGVTWKVWKMLNTSKPHVSV